MLHEELEQLLPVLPIILSNKKLCYREEHSTSVLFGWSTLSHLQSIRMNILYDLLRP